MQDTSLDEKRKSSSLMLKRKNNKMLLNYGVSFHWWSAAATTLHTHDFCEIFIITDGEAVHELNGERNVLTKGVLHFIKDTDTHIIKASKKCGCVHMNMCISNEKLLSVFSVLGIDKDDFFANAQMKTYLTADEIEFFTKRAEKIGLIKFEDEAASTVTVCELIIEAIILLYNSKNKSSSYYPDWFSQVLGKIHSPEFISCTANDVYSLGNFSPPAMIEYFKRYTGQTVVQYLKTVKMKNAKTLLKNTNLSILEISNMLGYASLSHFNKVFKDYTGMTPASYRKK